MVIFESFLDYVVFLEDLEEREWKWCDVQRRQSLYFEISFIL